MLDDEGCCSVYAFRPIPCRMFVSLTSPDWCDTTHPKAESAVNPHLEPLPPMRRLLLEIGTRLGLAHLPTDLFGGLDALAGLLDDGPFLLPTATCESPVST